MKPSVKVSMGVKMVCGKAWRREVAELIEEAFAILDANGRKYGKNNSFVRLPVVVAVNKKGITVTTQPGFFGEMEEWEL